MALLHINTSRGRTQPERPALESAPGTRPADITGRSMPVVVEAARPPGVRDAVGATVTAMPGLARVATVAVVRTAGWSVAASARTWGRLARAVVDPDEAARLSDDLSAVTGQVTEVARAIAQGSPVSEALGRWGIPVLERARDSLEERAGRRADGPEVLRRSGEELLRRSRDVWRDEPGHPAYAGILRDLAPDEARIVVLLLKDGPQPCVDVRQGGPIGRLQGSPVIARGLTMIGPRASVRHVESVPQYLNNLTRLGLVWQSPEPVADLLRYQVVEAQPDVLDAVHAVRRARVLRRSIHLTPFGQDFARSCFADADELALLPQHAAPPEAATAEPPAED